MQVLAPNLKKLFPSTLLTLHKRVLRNCLDLTKYFRKTEKYERVWPKKSMKEKVALFYRQSRDHMLLSVVDEMIVLGVAVKLHF